LLAAQVAVAFMGAMHGAPHALQFFGSVAVFVQVPSQSVSPGPQPILHMPPEHDVSPVQGLPHLPQFDMSVCVFTQVPEHMTRPPVHPASPPSLLPPVSGVLLPVSSGAPASMSENPPPLLAHASGTATRHAARAKSARSGFMTVLS
jgi:hypothetical protein